MKLRHLTHYEHELAISHATLLLKLQVKTQGVKQSMQNAWFYAESCFQNPLGEKGLQKYAIK